MAHNWEEITCNLERQISAEKTNFVHWILTTGRRVKIKANCNCRNDKCGGEGIVRDKDCRLISIFLHVYNLYSFIVNIISYILFFFWDNAQVPPQPMPEISETHLYYTKVLLPPWTYFINNFLPLFDLRGIILWVQRWLIFLKN